MYMEYLFNTGGVVWFSVEGYAWRIPSEILLSMDERLVSGIGSRSER